MPMSGSKKLREMWQVLPCFSGLNSSLKSMFFLFTVLIEFRPESSRVPQRLRIPVDSLRVCPTSDWRFCRSRSTSRCSLSSDKASNFCSWCSEVITARLFRALSPWICLGHLASKSSSTFLTGSSFGLQVFDLRPNVKLRHISGKC